MEGLDPETARAMVRLTLGGQMVTVSQYNLRPGTPPGSGEWPSNPPVTPSYPPVPPQ